MWEQKKRKIVKNLSIICQGLLGVLWMMVCYIYFTGLAAFLKSYNYYNIHVVHYRNTCTHLFPLSKMYCPRVSLAKPQSVLNSPCDEPFVPKNTLNFLAPLRTKVPYGFACLHVTSIGITSLMYSHLYTPIFIQPIPFLNQLAFFSVKVTWVQFSYSSDCWVQCKHVGIAIIRTLKRIQLGYVAA